VALRFARSLTLPFWLALGLAPPASAAFAGIADPPGPVADPPAALHGLKPGRSSFSGLGSRSPWIGLRLPGGGEAAQRASYPLDAGWLKVVPSVVLLPNGGPDQPGVVSIRLERQSPRDPLHVNAQYDWNGKSGGSIELGHRDGDRQLTLRGSSRPTGPITALMAGLPGSSVDGAWLQQLGSGTTATLVLQGDRIESEAREADASTARLVVRHRATDQVSVYAAANALAFRDAGDISADLVGLRRGVVSLGADYETAGLGLSAMLRSEENSATGQVGHGGRLTVRGAGDRWSARLSADVQQQAATLDLNVPGVLDVAARVAELGLSAASPEDVLHVLAGNGGGIVQQGVSVGALRVDPLRVQGAFDLAWRPADLEGARFGVRVAVNEFENRGGPQRAYIGRLYGSLRLFGDLDVSASYAGGLLQHELTADEDMTVFHLLVKRPL
jgi:hypothetical protein